MPDSRQHSGPPVLSGVQALRGVAALGVVATHLGGLWGDQYGPGAPARLQNGQAGVDLFFVISGVVMALSSTGSRQVRALTFLRRRFLRIAPLYWLLTLAAVLKVWLVVRVPALGSRTGQLPITGLDLLRSLSFVPYRNSAGTLYPALEVGWTLSFEWLFYVVFAAALALRLRPVRVLAVALPALALTHLFARPGWPAWTSLLSPLLLEFLAGVLLVEAVRRFGARLRSLPWLWAVLGLAGLALLAAPAVPPPVWPRLLVWGLPAFLVATAAVLLDPVLSGHLPRPLLALGDASYSLYLSHILVAIAVFRAERALLSEETVARLGFWPTALLTLAVCLACGVLLYRWVERPVTTALARWTGWNRGKAPLPVSTS